MLGGDIVVFAFFCFYISCFTYGTLILIYIMRLFMVYVFCFMFCEIKKFIMYLLVFSTHAFMCLLSVLGIYTLIQSWLLFTLAIDR